MESYEHATYLWGAYVTVRAPVDGVEEGYRSFVTFETLDEEAEASIFAEFWSWLDELRTSVRAQGRCVPGLLLLAGGRGVPDAPGSRHRGCRAAHRSRARAVLPLRRVGRPPPARQGAAPHRGAASGSRSWPARAGFSWRDEDPSGEASIGWYEEAVGADPAAARAARARLLAYNEDDVLATRALREWLDGPARQLPHVDEVLGQGR